MMLDRYENVLCRRHASKHTVLTGEKLRYMGGRL
jgi:hypothetical protein